MPFSFVLEELAYGSEEEDLRGVIAHTDESLWKVDQGIEFLLKD